MANFSLAIQPLLRREGGYVNHPSDRGGETKFGISKKQYPNLDIFNLTENEAKKIYKRDYWDKISGDLIKDQFTAEHLFDLAVNHGVSRGSKLIQESLGDLGQPVKIDGVIGFKSLNKINRTDSTKLNNTLVDNRINFYDKIVSNNPSQKVFYKGWIKRANEFKRADSKTSYFLIAGILVYLLAQHLKKGKL